MTSLVIHRWVPERGWASPGSWPLAVFCDRIRQCTSLRGTELKRAARRVMKREAMTLELVSTASAAALLHTLESLGARVTIQQAGLPSPDVQSSRRAESHAPHHAPRSQPDLPS